MKRGHSYVWVIRNRKPVKILLKDVDNIEEIFVTLKKAQKILNWDKEEREYNNETEELD